MPDYYDKTSVNKLVNMVDECEKVRSNVPTLGGNQEAWLLTEDGLYEVLMQSRKPIAKEFKKQVKVILKEIRKTGSFIVPTQQAEKIAVGKVMANADVEMLEMIQAMASKQIELKQELMLSQEKIEQLENTVIYKEDVIIGLVDDIDLATKRQRLNQIMRRGFKSGQAQADKWKLLYSEFTHKYHVDLKARIERDNKFEKRKFKNNLDYIDRKMDMIPQLYELACKIFENDVENLKKEWFDAVSN